MSFFHIFCRISCWKAVRFKSPAMETEYTGMMSRSWRGVAMNTSDRIFGSSTFRTRSLLPLIWMSSCEHVLWLSQCTWFEVPTKVKASSGARTNKAWSEGCSCSSLEKETRRIWTRFVFFHFFHARLLRILSVLMILSSYFSWDMTHIKLIWLIIFLSSWLPTHIFSPSIYVGPCNLLAFLRPWLKPTFRPQSFQQNEFWLRYWCVW